jgi:hypothetical protein
MSFAHAGGVGAVPIVEHPGLGAVAVAVAADGPFTEQFPSHFQL